MNHKNSAVSSSVVMPPIRRMSTKELTSPTSPAASPDRVAPIFSNTSDSEPVPAIKPDAANLSVAADQDASGVSEPVVFDGALFDQLESTSANNGAPANTAGADPQAEPVPANVPANVPADVPANAQANAQANDGLNQNGQVQAPRHRVFNRADKPDAAGSVGQPNEDDEPKLRHRVFKRDEPAPAADPAPGTNTAHANTVPLVPVQVSTSHSTPQQPVPVSTQLNPATQAPVAATDTDGDRKFSLQSQIKESVADLAFFRDIEKRLKDIVDKYKDPKGEVQALYMDTHHFVGALALQCGEYKKDYIENYGHLDDPIKAELEDLAQLGKGRTPEPRRTEHQTVPQHSQLSSSGFSRRSIGSLTGSRSGEDADSHADSAAEDDEDAKGLKLKETGRQIRRRATELDAYFASESFESEDDADLSKSQQRFEISSSEPKLKSIADPLRRAQTDASESLVDSSSESLDTLIAKLEPKKQT